MSSGGASETAPAPAHPRAESADGELAGRMARGDTSALEELYERYAPAVYGLIARLVQDPRDREEVLQDAFLSVWRHAAAYDGRRGRLSSWLMAIAHRKAIDLLRRRRHPSPVGLSRNFTRDPEGGLDAATWDAVAGQVQALDEREAIARALQLLRPEEQQVVLLAYFHGYTHKEIAGRFSIPLGTVKSRMRSAVERLRALLSEPQEPGHPASGADR